MSARPWVFSGAGVALLAGVWFLLANTGPGRAVEEVPAEPVALDDPELVKRIAEVAALEAHYKTYAAADIVSDEALGILSEAVEKQRAIARSASHGTYEQQTQLERLEGELGLLRAKRTVGKILQRITDGDEDVKAMRLADAEEAYKEALELQRAINTGSAP